MYVTQFDELLKEKKKLKNYLVNADQALFIDFTESSNLNDNDTFEEGRIDRKPWLIYPEDSFKQKWDFIIIA